MLPASRVEIAFNLLTLRPSPKVEGKGNNAQRQRYEDDFDRNFRATLLLGWKRRLHALDDDQADVKVNGCKYDPSHAIGPRHNPT